MNSGIIWTMFQRFEAMEKLHAKHKNICWKLKKKWMKQQKQKISFTVECKHETRELLNKCTTVGTTWDIGLMDMNGNAHANEYKLLRWILKW